MAPATSPKSPGSVDDCVMPVVFAEDQLLAEARLDPLVAKLEAGKPNAGAREEPGSEHRPENRDDDQHLEHRADDRQLLLEGRRAP